MPKRLIITIVCFHVSAVLTALFGIVGIVVGSFLSSLLGQMSSAMNDTSKQLPDMMNIPIHSYLPVIISIGIMILVYCIGIEIVIKGLNSRKYWAWIVGIVISGLMIISGLHNVVGLVIGGLSLWGLVDPDTVSAFKPQPNVELSSNSINTDDRI